MHNIQNPFFPVELGGIYDASYLSRMVEPSGLKVGCIDLPSTIPKLAIRSKNVIKKMSTIHVCGHHAHTEPTTPACFP
jgi:hypothetical protein